jgi:mycoredoxin
VLRFAPQSGIIPAGYDVAPNGLTKLLSPSEERVVLTMYSTTWCGYCHRLKSQLDREGIGYTVIDIERDPDAAAYVESVNRGNQTVPTLRFADGSALTNPSIIEVRDRLARVDAPQVTVSPAVPTQSTASTLSERAATPRWPAAG